MKRADTFAIVAAALQLVASPSWASDPPSTLASGYRFDLNVGTEATLYDSNEFVKSEAEHHLSTATDHIALQQTHSCLDYTVCVQLRLNKYVRRDVIDDNGVNQGNFDSPTDVTDWIVAHDRITDTQNGINVIVFANLLIGGQEYDEGVAMTDNEAIGFAVAAFDPNTTDDTDSDNWAHEFGHTLGLVDIDGGHPDDCGHNIMRGGVGDVIQAAVVQDNLSASQEQIMEQREGFFAPGSAFIVATSVKCNPTVEAAINNIQVLAEPSGVRISFSTFWEADHQDFVIEKLDRTTGAVLDTLAILPAGSGSGSKLYSTTDPTGTAGDVYRITERQTNSKPPQECGTYAAFGPVANGAYTYNADSLATLVRSWNGVTIEGVPLCNNVPAFAILCPDSFASALGPYASLWRGRGVTTEVVPTSVADSCYDGFRGYIQWVASHNYRTTYFLLVGDATDSLAWKNSAWWEGMPPGDPTEPEKNIIPTFYKYVPGGYHDAWTYWTPYYSTDLDYADTDNDGLPDVIVGRLPAHSVGQITAYTAKLSQWFSSTGGVLGAAPAVFTRAFNHNDVPAYITAFTADSLLSTFPPGATVQRADAVDLSGTGFPPPVVSDSVYAKVVSALSGAADLVVWNVNASGDRDNDFYREGMWSSNCATGIFPELPVTTRPFISLGLSCGFNNYDMTQDIWDCFPDGYGYAAHTVRLQPLIEDMLFQPNRGPITQIGPTRASYALANRLFGMEFLRRFYEPGSTVGRAFLLAQRECILKYPQYRDPLSAYVLLGDPRLGPSAITGVPETGTPWAVLHARARPNPFNPATVIEYFIPHQARVEVRIYDTQGRVVRRLVRFGLAQSGWSRVQWDGRTDRGSAVSSGVYFARVSSEGRSTTARLVVLR